MPFSCDKCKKIFKRNAHLERHNSRKTPCHRELMCNRCFKVFYKMCDLKIHNSRKFPCEDMKEELLLTAVIKKEELILTLAIEKERKSIEKEKTLQEMEKTKQAKLNQGKTVINNIQNIFGDQFVNILNIDTIEMLKPVSCWIAEELIKSGDVEETLRRMLKFQFNNDEYPERKCFKHHNGEVYSKLNNVVVEKKIYKPIVSNTISTLCKHMDYEYAQFTDEEMYSEGISQRFDYISTENMSTVTKVDKYIKNSRNNTLIDNVIKLSV